MLSFNTKFCKKLKLHDRLAKSSLGQGFQESSRSQFCWGQGWYAKFLLKFNFVFSPRETGVRLNLKINLLTMHISPGPDFSEGS